MSVRQRTAVAWKQANYFWVAEKDFDFEVIFQHSNILENKVLWFIKPLYFHQSISKHNKYIIEQYREHISVVTQKEATLSLFITATLEVQ